MTTSPDKPQEPEPLAHWERQLLEGRCCPDDCSECIQDKGYTLNPTPLVITSTQTLLHVFYHKGRREAARRRHTSDGGLGYTLIAWARRFDSKPGHRITDDQWRAFARGWRDYLSSQENVEPWYRVVTSRAPLYPEYYPISIPNSDLPTRPKLYEPRKPAKTIPFKNASPEVLGIMMGDLIFTVPEREPVEPHYGEDDPANILPDPERKPTYEELVDQNAKLKKIIVGLAGALGIGPDARANQTPDSTPPSPTQN